MKLTAEELWKRNRDTADACLAHPFVQGIASGVPHVPAAQLAGLSSTGTRDGPMAAVAEGYEIAACTNIGTGTTNWGRSATYAPNEIYLQRYRPGSLGITPHLDGKRYRRLVAFFTVRGSACLALSPGAVTLACELK